MIRQAEAKDAAQICDIYNYYVKNTCITFEEEDVKVTEMRARLEESISWLVWEEQQEVLGFAYATKWKGRCAYRYSAEFTVYVRHNQLGKKIGLQLYTNLLDTIKSKNFHTVIAGIALPNEQSQSLHKKLGFQKVAHFSEVGFKFQKWVDVAYWQLNLANVPSANGQ